MIIDTQSVRVAAGVPKETTGLDANKKTPGRKRGLAVDVLGLIIGVVILAANAHDNEAGIALVDQAAERCGMRLEKVLVDQGFEDAVIIHGAVKDITVEVVRRNPDDEGKSFVPQPKRWVVEICQAQCTHGVCSAVSAVSVQMRRLYQPGGRVRRSRSSASSRWSAWAMRRWGQQLSRRTVIQPRLIQV